MVRNRILNGKPVSLDMLRYYIAGQRAAGVSYKAIIEDPTNSVTCKQTIINYCKWVKKGGPLIPTKPMGRPRIHPVGTKSRQKRAAGNAGKDKRKSASAVATVSEASS